MDSIAYLGESAALGLLGRALALTAFYTAILWLPLRGMAIGWDGATITDPRWMRMTIMRDRHSWTMTISQTPLSPMDFLSYPLQP